jgi:hypothetical protein
MTYSYFEETTYCAICGKKIITSLVKGADNRLYIRINNAFIRIRKLSYLFVACEQCLKDNKLIIDYE